MSKFRVFCTRSRTVLVVFACTPAELGIYLELPCELLRIVSSVTPSFAAETAKWTS